MKNKTITMAAVMLALGSSGIAQNTDVYVTGATAFRSATLNTIRTIFANSGQFKIVHSGGNGGYNGSQYAIIQGTFSNVPGTTTIYTSFNGSVEGIRALATTNNNPEYLTASALTNATSFIPQGSTTADGVSGISAPRAAAASDFAFSDVAKASTPFGSAFLLPASPQVGVVTFSMVANRGTTNAIDNLNTQNFRALLGRGYIPRKMITGNTNDNGVVYVMGRNDGSGTRTTYAAESGFGITTPMNQYIMGAASGGAMTAIYLVPAGGTNAALNGSTNNGGLGLIGAAGNASTVWNQNVDGNGGYVSGGNLIAALTNTSASVTVYEADGNLFEANQDISVVSFLSTGDTRTAMTGGAIALGYNGVKLSDFATNGGTITTADRNKITQGAYTAWGYQYFYRLPTITSGNKLSVYNLMFSNIPSNLGSAGLAKNLMQVARQVDGGVVTP